MKKFLYTVGLATVILLNAAVVRASNDVYYTNSNGIEMTQTEYDNLVSQAFTEDQIARMSEHEFNDRKDSHGTIVGENTQYIRIRTTIINGIKYTVSTPLSELQYNQGVLQAQQPTYSPNVSGNYYDGYFYDGYLNLATHIINFDDNTFIYKLDSYWDIIPTDQYNDIMGIGIDASKIQVASLIVCREDWQTTSDVFGYEDQCWTKTESTGGSVIFELPGLSNLKNLSSYMYFFITKNPNVGTLSYISAVGNYAHATAYYDPDATNGIYDNHQATIGGLYVGSPYASHYNIVSLATAEFYGTW